MVRFLVVALVAWTLACGTTRAQTQYAGQGLPVTDPSAFSQSLAFQISRDRMEPLRRTMQEMLGVTQLSSELEVSLTQMERFLGQEAGTQITKLEDISLAGTLRRLYYLNAFPGKFLFTRYDFIRSPDGWVLTGVTFGSTWNSVNANPVTPGWTTTQ